MSSAWRSALRPIAAAVARGVPDGVFKRLYALAKTGRWPRLQEPQTFSDRLLHRSLNAKDPLLALTGDKYTLRAFVTERVGKEHLPHLYQVLQQGDRLDPTSWAERAVVKASHASGWNRFVQRGVSDMETLQAEVNRWLSASYATFRGEGHYATMTPRVVVEEDLSRDGRPPDDYKFFVFAGRPRMVAVDQDRFGEHRRFVADEQWRPLAIRYDYPQPETDPQPPAALGQMSDLASRLGQGLPFVRVDLYQVDGRVLVGELTHFPGAGVPRFSPRSFDAELGAVWGEARAIAPSWLRDGRSAGVDGAGP